MGRLSSQTQSEDFWLSGPSDLTAVDWTNEHHTRSVAASLVQGVYISERDRQKKREGSQALAPPWWEFFHFKMLCPLKDDADSFIFGAIYEFEPPPACNRNLPTGGIPRYVIAFRGTIIKPQSLGRDFGLDVRIIRNDHHRTSCYDIAIEAVTNMVTSVDRPNVWLAGHSLGSMALLVGKTMAMTGFFLKSFLFNPPFTSAPIERIKNTEVKRWIRIAGSVFTAGLARGMKKTNHNNQSVDPFLALSAWVPYLYVNRNDPICAEYIGYFEHRKTMEEKELGGIGRLATQHSLVCLFLNAMGKESEPNHLIPSANLMVNLTRDGEAHGIRQWWRPDLHLETKLYRYS